MGRRGAVTPSKRLLGEPTFTNDYALCIYDESSPGPSPSLLLRATAPAGAECGNRPCWSVLPRKAAFSFQRQGFFYTDASGGADGMKRMRVQAGNGGTKLRAQASGTPFTLPQLPVPLPLLVQVQAENGTCWEATYDGATTRRNDATRFEGVAAD